jgi:dipeptidyl aminopeptidase/acylaminoacyl peptidase
VLTSYGGYCVNALVTQTSRFRAAISSAGVCDLVSAYGVLTENGDNPGIGRAELGQRRMGGPPWEYPERYVENSPIFHLGRVETPLLLLHGALDISCPVSQAGEMFSGLRRLGKEVVLVQYLDEGHWPGQWRYANAVDYWQRVLDWLDSHLGVASRDPGEVS